MSALLGIFYSGFHPVSRKASQIKFGEFPLGVWLPLITTAIPEACSRNFRNLGGLTKLGERTSVDETLCNVSTMSGWSRLRDKYRVTMVVAHLGWVDLHLGCSTCLLGSKYLQNGPPAMETPQI